MRTEADIQALADQAALTYGKATRYRNMTYEDGVREALEWVLDESIPDAEAPLA
jgi:hypothetical protein